MFRTTIGVAALVLVAVFHTGCAPAASSTAGWTRDGVPTAAALAVMRVLRQADSFGLRPQDYEGAWSGYSRVRVSGRDPGGTASFDASLSIAAGRVLNDVHFGRVDPHAAGFNLTSVRLPLNIPLLLARYKLLASSAAVPTPEERRSAPFARRVRQIELTLERWRWLPAFDTPPIIVNLPQFRLFAFRSTQDRKSQILQMDVIVGRTFVRTQTPVFMADMRYLIFRPYWDVPFSITRQEMLPAIRANPN